MTSLFFLGGKRTPFGSYGGSLKDAHPTDLSVCASKAALEQAQVSATEIDHVIFGNVIHSTADSIYTPRHIGLKLGVPESIPALGVNRLCGTGFQVVIEAFHQMLAGDTRIALVGGVENMSLSPYAFRGGRWGVKMGNTKLEDVMTESLVDTFVGAPMAITAENLAAKYGITRDQTDELALRSQKHYAAALATGKFQTEITPYVTQDRKGNTLTLERDEHPKPETTMETLSKLKPLFQKDGFVTAGNASGIVDGAAALVVASEDEVKRRKAVPLGRLVSYGVSGCDPKIMGIGPAPSSRAALKKAGLTLSQMDLIEINEAFAQQAAAVQKELEIPTEKLNVNGGAVAVGHPLAASGTRLIQTALYELKRRQKRYALVSACIGGGQGIAMVLERI